MYFLKVKAFQILQGLNYQGADVCNVSMTGRSGAQKRFSYGLIFFSHILKKYKLLFLINILKSVLFNIYGS